MTPDFGKPTTSHINLRVQDWLLEAIDEVAAEADQTRSDVIRGVLAEEFEQFRPATVYQLPPPAA